MLLGIDSGGTAGKAVVYDDEGRALGVGTTRSRRLTPQDRWAERDMDESWRDCACSIAEALRAADVTGAQIDAVGITGHGDGIYLLDEAGRPVRNGILAVDSRTSSILARWRSDGVLDAVRELTGQQLFEPSQAALCAWLARFEPAALERTRWILTAKDWLRFCLTGQVGTDRSEAMASFGARDGSGYDPRVAEMLGIARVNGLLPPMSAPTDVAGAITVRAAATTGLRAGTPVAFGTHDVVAGALGAGVVTPERICVVAGTWGVNEVLGVERVIDPRWQSRPWIEPGQWLHMAASPASASNLDWLVQSVFGPDGSDLTALGREVERAAEEDSRLVFFPFLYGSPYGADASAAFLGLSGWHRRGHLARAVFEGVVFNHVVQVDALRSCFGSHPIRLTGGGARSAVWGQMFADVADASVEVPDVDETGCRGAALCAAVAVGARDSVHDAARDTLRIRAVYEPDGHRRARLAEAFDRYRSVLEPLATIWSMLGAGKEA